MSAGNTFLFDPKIFSETIISAFTIMLLPTEKNSDDEKYTEKQETFLQTDQDLQKKLFEEQNQVDPQNKANYTHTVVSQQREDDAMSKGETQKVAVNAEKK